MNHFRFKIKSAYRFFAVSYSRTYLKKLMMGFHFALTWTFLDVFIKFQAKTSKKNQTSVARSRHFWLFQRKLGENWQKTIDAIFQSSLKNRGWDPLQHTWMNNISHVIPATANVIWDRMTLMNNWFVFLLRRVLRERRRARIGTLRRRETENWTSFAISILFVPLWSGNTGNRVNAFVKVMMKEFDGLTPKMGRTMLLLCSLERDIRVIFI